MVKCFDSCLGVSSESPYELNKYLIPLTSLYCSTTGSLASSSLHSSGLQQDWLRNIVCALQQEVKEKSTEHVCVCVFMQGPSIGRRPLTRGNIWTFEDYFHNFSSWFGLPQLVVTTHTMTLHRQQQKCPLACSKQHQCTHIAVQIVCMQGLLVLALSW